MKNSKTLPVSILAIMGVLSGLTIATAQTAAETTPVRTETAKQVPAVMPVDFRGPHGDRGGRGMLGQILKMVDADGDRAVTQAEIDMFRAAIVADADASGEGDISLDEFEKIYLDLTRTRMVDAFQKLDEDGDGVVTKAEMDNRFGHVVERMDRNDDGKLDRDDRGGRNHTGHDRGGPRHGDRRG